MNLWRLLSFKFFSRADSNKDFELYTDGGFKNGVGSWAAVLIRNNLIEREISGVNRKTTALRMELQAAIEGLNVLPQGSHVTLYSDCKIMIDKLNAQEYFSASDVHHDLYQQLAVLCRRHSVVWKWIQGHAGDRYNERCDELCRLARSTA